MDKKIFYEKVGRRYKPVYEYDQKLMDALPKGTHLIQVYPGGKSTRYNIDPNYAALIAASRVAEDAISSAIMQATEIRRNSRAKETPLTPEQREAWENLIKAFGPDAKQLEWPSVRECAEAGVKALENEANKLMSHPSVKKSFDNFQLICKLVAEGNNDN